MTTEIQRISLGELGMLQQIGIETFTDTFAHQNTPENMKAYLDKAFSAGQLDKELSEPFSEFYFLNVEGETAGYLKLNAGEAQSESMGDGALEIERIYVRTKFQKRGFGKLLIHAAVEIAAEQGMRSLWLGVWEKNDNAIAFYEKMGFVRTGTHIFMMGDEEQTDHLMTRLL